MCDAHQVLIGCCVGDCGRQSATMATAQIPKGFFWQLIKILPALNLFPQSSSLKEENEIKEVIPSSSGGYRRHSASLGSLMRCYALLAGNDDVNLQKKKILVRSSVWHHKVDQVHQVKRHIWTCRTVFPPQSFFLNPHTTWDNKSFFRSNPVAFSPIAGELPKK